MIKTKLKGHARNLINNENSISEIIKKLKNKVKGESINPTETENSQSMYSRSREIGKGNRRSLHKDILSLDLATQYSKVKHKGWPGRIN